MHAATARGETTLAHVQTVLQGTVPAMDSPGDLRGKAGASAAFGPK
jgi:hypothetical protein